MSKKEEKARQYSNKKVEEKGLYPLCSLYVQRRLTTFDAYELEDAFEAGWDACEAESIEIIKTAEDHAYFAGSEAMREKLIDKDCEFLKSYRSDYPDGTGYVAGIVDDTTIEELRKFMEK